MKIYIEYERVEGKPFNRMINVKDINEGKEIYNKVKNSLLKQNIENEKSNYIDGLVIECKLIAEDDKTIILYDNLLKDHIKKIL